MDDAAGQAITQAIKEIIAQINPDVRYLPKYGGEVLGLDPSNDASFVGGIFTYKDHVSLEFSQGTALDDPDGHLDGKGKLRRHLKLHSAGDVAAKDVAGFLQQVIAP